LSANNSDDVGIFPRILGSFSSAQLSVPSGRIDAQEGNRLESFNVAKILIHSPKGFRSWASQEPTMLLVWHQEEVMQADHSHREEVIQVDKIRQLQYYYFINADVDVDTCHAKAVMLHSSMSTHAMQKPSCFTQSTKFMLYDVYESFARPATSILCSLSPASSAFVFQLVGKY
jgi:hypothetical protein